MSITLTEFHKLLSAWTQGEDCRSRLHDCCLELGFPYVAEHHFSTTNPQSCKDPDSCIFGNIYGNEEGVISFSKLRRALPREERYLIQKHNNHNYKGTL